MSAFRCHHHHHSPSHLSPPFSSVNGAYNSAMDMGSTSVTDSGGSSSSPALNGLKFGQKIYFENMCSGDVKSGAGPSSSAAATHKKGRGAVFQSGHPPRCQVVGCNVDLSDAKAYYSRHKVCGMHSKFPMVIVAGLEQRFCQQCSRFHQLQEFDQGKRSCRRRLAGHNERRRKPPPGSLYSTRYGHLSPSIVDNGSRVGSILMDFSAYRELAGREAWSSSRSSGRVTENQANTTTGKLLPHSWQNDTGDTSSQLFQNSTGGTGDLGPGIPSVECIAGVTDSTCALSLLSNQPWGSSNHRAPGYGVNPSMNHLGMPVAQTTTHGSSVDHFSGTSWGVKGNEVISCSNKMTSDLGPCQTSPPFNASYSVELELPQQGRRQYPELMHPRPFDLSTQQTHWSL